MTIQILNVGAPVTGAGGDSYRTAHTKINANFVDVIAQARTISAGETKALKDKMIVGGDNLFNAKTVTPASKLDPATGAVIADTAPGSPGVSQFITVTPGGVYTASGDIVPADTFAGMAQYDANKNFLRIGGVLDRNIASVTFTLPNDTRYIRLATRGDPNTRNRMLNAGPVALPYSQYGTSLRPELLEGLDIGGPDVDVTGILNQAAATAATQADARVKTLKDQIITGGENLFNAKGAILNTKIDPATGGEVAAAPTEVISVTPYIPVTGGAVYTASGDIVPADTFAGMAQYGADKNFLRVGGIVDRNIASVTFTLPSDTNFVRLIVRGDPNERNRMLNKGATALPWTPYGTSLRPELLAGLNLGGGTGGTGPPPPAAPTITPVREKEKLIFTGDRHPAIYAIFPDSHTANDPKPIAPVTGMQVTRQDVYNWWDALVAEFPGYITKVLLGKDTSNTYDIFAYRFIPETPHGFNTGIRNTVRPRIMFAVTHIEQFNQLYPLIAMREICRKWKTDPALAALRWECEFVAIPMAHPYGMQPGGDYRVVANGINVNGDFGYGWAVRTGALPTGAAPYATAETTHIKNEAERFKPHMLCDLHANSASDEGSGAWIDTENQDMKDVAVKSLTSMYTKHVAYDPLSPPINELLKITYAATFPDGGIAGSGGGSLGAYAYATGCIGGLCEFTHNYGRHAFTEGLHNRNIVFGTNLLLNYFVNGVASYRDNGAPVDNPINPRPLKYGKLER